MPPEKIFDILTRPSHSLSMAYLFEQIETHRTITCEDDEWHGHLAAARGNGWDEEGTRYDFPYQVDEEYDSMTDYLYNLWMILHLSRELFAWDGNYTEKKNQVVSDSDAYYLSQALAGAWQSEDRNLLEFMEAGSFRICAG
jgi:hypothetical protein